MSKRKYSSESESTMSHRHESPAFIAATVIIDPDGDLTMKFNGGKLKVSRKVMSISSPVYMAMLGKECPFKESADKEVGLDGTQAIDFEDDDFQTMIVIARVIHLQSDKVPDKLSFKQLYQVAVLCDKYDLRRCLGPWPRLWANPYLDSYRIEGYEGWLFMSIVFGYGGLFKEVTRHMILNSKLSETGSLVTSKGVKFGDHVSSTIIERITKLRSVTLSSVLNLHRQEYSKLLKSKKEHVCKVGGTNTAKCDAINLGCLLQEFPEFGDGNDDTGTPCWRTVNSVVEGSEMIVNACEHRACPVGPRLAVGARKVLECVHGLDLHGLGVGVL